MRIVWVLIVGSILLFSITVGWYISMPVVMGFSRGINATIYGSASARNALTAIEYASIAWGPLLDIFVLLWMIMSASKKDVESQIYG